jgi:nicotinate phosphoribosyltransferase
LVLTSSESIFLKGIGYLPEVFIDLLRGYRLNPEEVSIKQDEDGHLDITIEGYWWRTIYWEVMLMAIISELYFRETGQEVDIFEEELQIKDIAKTKTLGEHGLFHADFGTRRRYSFNNQERIVKLFRKEGNGFFVGTSNVYLAKNFNMKPIGTMAHEWIMVHGAIYGYKMANQLAFENWTDVYGGNLGIALSDTYTTDVFFKTFGMKEAKLFDGVRHDSGSPYSFIDKVCGHYDNLNIDPLSKVIIFSDGLNVEEAVNIKKECVGKIKSSAGIGTNLTNDVGVKPLNIVIKISDVFINGEWVPAVKLSDNPGKHTGDETEVELCKGILRINNK